MRYLSLEINRLLNEERKMAFISGPRQVGKTTLAKSLQTEKDQPQHYCNWDIESHRRAIIKAPEEFWKAEEEAPSFSNAPPIVVLDEIHKYPRWKRFLKGFYDAHAEELKIVVTGSGRLDVYQRGGDSLVGRYHLYHLHPFTLGEFLASGIQTILLPKEFWENLDASVSSGTSEGLTLLEKFTGFAEPLFSANETKLRRWRNNYQSLIIREDLRDLTRIRELGLIETLVSLLPERVGSPLSINALKEDLGVNFVTVQRWIEALERLYFLFSLRPYAGRLARTLRKETKVYLFDYSIIENPGARFENMVALHLKKLCQAWTDFGYGDFDLYYVRDREKREVAFLITETRKPYALIEAKLAEEAVSSHLKYFADRLKPRYVVQVTRNMRNSFVKMADRAWRVRADRFLSLI